MTLCKKKKKNEIKNDRVFCFIRRTVSNNVKDNLLSSIRILSDSRAKYSNNEILFI